MKDRRPEPLDPLIVLVPGLGLDDRAWRLVRQRLTGRVHTALLPSIGRRSPRGMDLRVERQAERLLRELIVQGAGAVVLVAHSASCPVVVEAAVRSQIVVGLVLIGPVTDPRAVTWPRILGQWLRAASHERPWEVPVLMPQYLRTGAVTMVRGMDAMRWYRTDRALSRLGIPVVVVRGARDRIASENGRPDSPRSRAAASRKSVAPPTWFPSRTPTQSQRRCAKLLPPRQGDDPAGRRLECQGPRTGTARASTSGNVRGSPAGTGPHGRAFH